MRAKKPPTPNSELNFRRHNLLRFTFCNISSLVCLCIFLCVSVSRALRRAATPMRKRIWKVGEVHKPSLLYFACSQHCDIPTLTSVVPLLASSAAAQTLSCQKTTESLTSKHHISRHPFEESNTGLRGHPRVCDQMLSFILL